MEDLTERRCQALLGDRKGERIRGCIILRGVMEARGTAILSEDAVCLGILGVPSAFYTRTWLSSLRDGKYLGLT